VSEEPLPILKEVLLTLNLGRRPLKIWGFIAEITNELILGLDILCTYDAFVDIGSQTATGRERGIVMEPMSGAPFFQPGSGQGSRNTCTVLDWRAPSEEKMVW
jgi:hypothetical protein